MKLKITKGARQFGYLIWNQRYQKEIDKLLTDRESVSIILNGFNLGEKNIDRKYHRISLGYKMTRALPEDHNTYSLKMKNGVLEVKTINDSK